MHKTVIGVALGSGAARGWCHIGVLRALEEIGVKPEIVCGTSIGALVGGCYLSDNLDILEDWVNRQTKYRIYRYLNVRSMRNGLFAGDRLFSEIERHLGEVRIEALPQPFAAVATDLRNGQEVWLTGGDLVSAIRASCSFPAFFSPVVIDGRWLVDGALVNPVPISVCRALGANLVIAVNLNANSPMRLSGGPAEGPGSAGRGPGARSSRSLRNHCGATAGDDDPPTPGLLTVMSSTLNIVQDRVSRARIAADPPEISVSPGIGRVGLLDFHRAGEAIRLGEAAVYQAEADIRALLEDYSAGPERMTFFS